MDDEHPRDGETPESETHRPTLLEVTAAPSQAAAPPQPPAPDPTPPTADDAPPPPGDAAAPPRHQPPDGAATDVARSALGLDEGEPAAGLEVVCHRCGAVQLRAVACRQCAAPLGEYAVQDTGGLTQIVEELGRRRLLWPAIGVLVVLLALLAAVVLSGGDDGSAAAPPDPHPLVSAPTAASTTPPAADDSVTLADLEAPDDPRAAALLDKPPADEPPFVAVNRIKAGMYGPLQAKGFTSRKLKKRGQSMIEVALPAGWVLFLSGPEVHRLPPSGRQILAPGRYEMAAELPARAGPRGQPLFLDLYLEAGRKYLVSNRSIHELMDELKKKSKPRRRKSRKRR